MFGNALEVEESQLHDFIKYFIPIFTLIHDICYPESTKFSTEATQYGCENEKRAIEAYKDRMVGKHAELKVTPAGLVLYLKNPCFGAPPDSFVEYKCCGIGVLS